MRITLTNVFVDDQPVGTTPLAGLDIAPGDHHIRVVREGHRPFEQVVTFYGSNARS